MASRNTEIVRVEGDSLRRLYSRYYTQYLIKEPKRSLMETIAKYVDPDDQILSRRTGNTDVSDILFDTDAQIELEKSSKNSISDIVNMYEAWFSLNVRKEPNLDEQLLLDWTIENTGNLLNFITDSSYYESLVLDKWYYDLYGFTAMTIWDEGGKLLTYTEDPFKLVYETKIDGYNAAYWIKYYTDKELKASFDYESEKKSSSFKHTVLCCIVPNTESFLGDRIEFPDKEYVQLFIYLGEEITVEGQTQGSSQQTQGDELRMSAGSKEIGKRQYFDEMPTIPNRDTLGHRRQYGNGYGRRVLTTAQNLNEIKRGMIRTMAFASNPPVIGPTDVFQAYRNLEPGRFYPTSYSGQEIRYLEPPGDLEKQTHFLAVERESLNKAIPNVNPPQKKARQSAIEIQKLLTEVGRNQFIYKIPYLKNGVSKHLQAIFRIAVKLGKVTKPPGNLTIDDVTPSLSNLIAKEMKRNKARAYVEGLQLAQGYLALDREALDEIDTHSAVRKIMVAVGAEDILNTSRVRDAIKQEREKQLAAAQEHQQRLELAQAQTQGLLVSAQADALRAKADKDSAQAGAVE